MEGGRKSVRIRKRHARLISVALQNSCTQSTFLRRKALSLRLVSDVLSELKETWLGVR